MIANDKQLSKKMAMAPYFASMATLLSAVDTEPARCIEIPNFPWHIVARFAGTQFSLAH